MTRTGTAPAVTGSGRRDLGDRVECGGDERGGPGGKVQAGAIAAVYRRGLLPPGRGRWAAPGRQPVTSVSVSVVWVPP